MVLLYAKLVGRQQFPTATATSDSSRVLSESQDEAILTRGNSHLSVKDLVLRFVSQLALIRPTAIRGGRVYGHRLMDIVRGKYEVEPDIITLRPRPNWTLLKKIQCLLTSNVGNVINANLGAYSVCNELIGQQNYLAATVRSLNEISLHCGQQDFSNSIRRLPGGFWTCENAFTACHHSQRSDTSCWDKPSFLQSIRKKEKDRTGSIPSRGVVVFGGEGSNLWEISFGLIDLFCLVLLLILLSLCCCLHNETV